MGILSYFLRRPEVTLPGSEIYGPRGTVAAQLQRSLENSALVNGIGTMSRYKDTSLLCQIRDHSGRTLSREKGNFFGRYSTYSVVEHDVHLIESQLALLKRNLDTLQSQEAFEKGLKSESQNRLRRYQSRYLESQRAYDYEVSQRGVIGKLVYSLSAQGKSAKRDLEIRRNRYETEKRRYQEIKSKPSTTLRTTVQQVLSSRIDGFEHQLSLLYGQGDTLRAEGRIAGVFTTMLAEEIAEKRLRDSREIVEKIALDLDMIIVSEYDSPSLSKIADAKRQKDLLTNVQQQIAKLPSLIGDYRAEINRNPLLIEAEKKVDQDLAARS